MSWSWASKKGVLIMSHTLHRSGDVGSLKNDYVILSLSAQGLNRDGAGPKLGSIVQTFSKYNPVNCGILGSDTVITMDLPDEFLQGIENNSVVHAVFDNINDLKDCLTDLKENDYGLSIVVSGLFEHVHECCKKVGIKPHTVNQSLGIFGNLDRLPKEEKVRDISTMCGHGMVPFALIKEYVEKIKKGTITAEKAAEKITPLCTCKIFNPKRAAILLDELSKE